MKYTDFDTYALERKGEVGTLVGRNGEMKKRLILYSNFSVSVTRFARSHL